MDVKPLVSIVIPTLNRENNLIQCLDSLLTQTYSNFNVVIVDGGSTYDLNATLKRFSNSMEIKLVIVEPKLTRQKNIGWKKGNGEIVAFIDDDIVADPNWLKEIVQTYLESDKVGGVSGPAIVPKDRLNSRDLLFYDNKYDEERNLIWKVGWKIYERVLLEGNPRALCKYYKSGAYSLGSNYPESKLIPVIVEVDDLPPCNMTFRRDVLLTVQGFDEKYSGIGTYSEPDLCFRVRKRGYRLFFNPKASVTHFISKSGAFGKRAFAFVQIKNLYLLQLRHNIPSSLTDLFRFGIYILFLDCYWFLMFIKSKNVAWLSGISGNITGLMAAIKLRNESC